MILKQYEVSKIDIKKFPIILFYGQNNGAKEEETSKLIKQDKNIKPNIYEEKEILENYEALYNDIVSDSLFDERKIFVIKRVTDKSFITTPAYFNIPNIKKINKLGTDNEIN